MTKLCVESICDLSMIKADYRQITPHEGSPFWGYQIAVRLDQETLAQFEVRQETADQLADQLGTLAALIRAHTRHRISEQL